MRILKRITALVCLLSLLMSVAAFAYGNYSVMSYPGTNVPVYNRVTYGNPIDKIWYRNGGAVGYVYNYTDINAVNNYLSYLISAEWELFNYEIEDYGYEAYGFHKDGMIVWVIYQPYEVEVQFWYMGY